MEIDLPDGLYLVKDGKLYRAANWKPPEGVKSIVLPPFELETEEEKT